MLRLYRRSPGRRAHVRGRSNLVVFVLTAGFASGCATSVTPDDDPHDAPLLVVDADAATADAPSPEAAVAVDAPAACALPDGRACERGQTCPAGDGCNHCECSTDGQLVCSNDACDDAAVAPQQRRRTGCHVRSDCPHGDLCFHEHPGCDDVGECKYPNECADDSAPKEYCGCDGTTRTVTCGDYGVDVAYRAEGACG